MDRGAPIGDFQGQELSDSHPVPPSFPGVVVLSKVPPTLSTSDPHKPPSPGREKERPLVDRGFEGPTIGYHRVSVEFFGDFWGPREGPFSGSEWLSTLVKVPQVSGNSG